jgi:hypothetical protein
MVLLAAVGSTAQAEDVVEFLSGASMKGKVVGIDKVKRTIEFDGRIGGRRVTRTFSYGKIHAVTYNGKRYVINEKTAPQAAAASGPALKSNSSSNPSARRRPIGTSRRR